MRRMRAVSGVLITGLTFAACFQPVAEFEEHGAVALDAGERATIDAGTPDASGPDASMEDAAVDAGIADAGTPDASIDAGTDAGIDGGHDAGTLLGRLWFLRTAVPMLPQVFVQSPIGTEPKLVSAPGRGVTNMLVSKDGATIAIAYPGANQEIFVGSTDGGSARLVWSQPGDRLYLTALAPDKGQLAFYEESGGKGVIRVLPLDGGVSFEGTPRVGAVDWAQFKARFSPSSRFLAVNPGELSTEFDAGLYVTDTSSRSMEPVKLPWSLGSSPTRFGWFAEDRLVANAFHPDNGSTLVVCDGASGCTVLPDLVGGDVRLIDKERLHVAARRAFVVLANSSEDAGVRSTQVFRAPLDGGTPRLVGSLPDRPIWGSALTPDEEQLVVFVTTSDFVTPRDLEVYLVPMNGASSVTRLSVLPWPVLNEPVGDSESLFEPGGEHMVFRKVDPGVSYQLWRIDLRTPMQMPVFQQQGELWGERFEWTP